MFKLWRLKDISRLKVTSRFLTWSFNASGGQKVSVFSELPRAQSLFCQNWVYWPSLYKLTRQRRIMLWMYMKTSAVNELSGFVYTICCSHVAVLSFESFLKTSEWRHTDGVPLSHRSAARLRMIKNDTVTRGRNGETVKRREGEMARGRNSSEGVISLTQWVAQQTFHRNCTFCWNETWTLSE